MDFRCACVWGNDRGGNSGGFEVCGDGNEDFMIFIIKVDILFVKL